MSLGQEGEGALYASSEHIAPSGPAAPPALFTKSPRHLSLRGPRRTLQTEKDRLPGALGLNKKENGELR